MPATARPEPSATTKEIAAILTGVLARNGIEQQELARAMSISRPQMSRMLSGAKHWDIDQLDAACRFLGIDLYETIREAERTVANRATVSAPAQDDDEDFEVTDEVRSSYAKAASKGKRKADQPHAE